MSDAAKIYLGGVGVEILIDCNQTISTATNTQMIVKKPSGALATWTASISGTDSLSYTTGTTDMKEIGIYYIHPKMTLGGWTGYGTPVVVEVLELHKGA